MTSESALIEAASERQKALSRALLPMMLVLFVATLDQTIVASALGPIGKALGGSDVSWIATAYLLTGALSTLILGRIADVFGKKRTFQVTLGLFIVASCLCAVARTLPALIAFRALQGVGGGALSSLVMTIVAALAPPRARGKYQAALGIVPAIAVVCGPLIGGLIVEHMGWWWIFLVNLPIGLVAMALVAIHLNVSEAPHAAHYAGHRAGLSASLVAPNIFWSSAVLFMLATAVLFVGMLYIPLTLQDVYALSPATAGASIIPMLFGLVAASGVAGTVVARTGRYRAIPTVGTVCMGMSLGWLTATPGSPSPTLIICAGTTLGVGVGLVIQSALLAGQNAVAERHLGLGTGILNFFKTIGGALGASAAVLVRLVLPAESASLFQSYRFCFGAGLVAGVASIVVALLLRERPLSATMTEVASGATEAPEF